MIRNLSYIILGLLVFQMSPNASLRAEPAAVPHATVETKFDGVWRGQTGSLWDGSALFFANGLKRQETAPPIPETANTPKKIKKGSPSPWHELDRKVMTARLMAASA